MGGDAAAQSTERKVVITRVFDAPREVVFRAWIDPKHLAKWWGPECFTNPVCEVDARPGGAVRIVMRAPDGADHPMRGVFREIVAPERLAFTNFAVDENDSPMIDGFTTVTFVEHDGKATMTLETTAKPLVASAARMIEGMQTGWSQSLDKLTAYLRRK